MTSLAGRNSKDIRAPQEKRLYDIVVPVFGGLLFFEKCYESLLRNTPQGHTIIIVDDGSVDQDLLQFYDSIDDQEGVVILRLPKNKGYVHAANLGMTYSQNEVILLNSDTEVTPGWLEKLDAALFSAPNIGTATPWTNNGTICSLPEFCKNNQLPADIALDQYAAIVEDVCPGEYLELPTGVGFCMAIKRQVLNEIGLFDEETYNRGYGEENDLCMRAREHGYSNVLDDRTFIYHHGQLSFQEDKRALSEKNTKTLIKRHPTYKLLVDQFIEADPLFPLRSLTLRRLEDLKGIKHVLFVVHIDPVEGGSFSSAGTEMHVLDLANHLAESGQVVPFVFVSNGTELGLLERDSAGNWRRIRWVLSEKIVFAARFSQEYKDRLQELLAIYHIDVIHYQHLMHHPVDIPSALGEWQGAVFMTLHDYYAICPASHLVNSHGNYCLQAETFDNCQQCVQKKSNRQVDPVYWRKMFTRNLERVDKLYSPSEGMGKTIIQNLQPHLQRKIVVREHGVVLSNHYGKQAKKRFMHSPLRIGFVGRLAAHKGSKLIIEMIRAKTNNAFEWFLIGEIDDTELSALENQNVQRVGPYERGDLPRVFSGLELDLAVFCSICPESFSYTLSEVWACGIPVLVGPLGAPAERVATQGGGWLADELTATAFIDKLHEIAAAPEEYNKVYDVVCNMSQKTAKEVAREYLADYLAVPDSVSGQEERHNGMCFRAQRVIDSPGDLMRISQNCIELRERVKDLETDLLAEQERVEPLNKQLVELGKQLSVAGQKLQQSEASIQELEKHIKHFENTLSWRLTAPLRKIALVARNIVRGAG